MILGSFYAIVSKGPVTRKPVAAESNRSSDCVSYMGYFHLLMFKVILGSVGAHLSNCQLSQIWLSVEQLELKFRTMGHK